MVLVASVSTLSCLDLNFESLTASNGEEVNVFEVGDEDAPALKLDDSGSKMLSGPTYSAYPERFLI